MSSLRRSGRTRAGAGDDGAAGGSSAQTSPSRDAVTDTGRPKRKRATSSSQNSSPETGRTTRGSGSAAGSPSQQEAESPLRSRSGRRIIVKGSAGRFNKAQRASDSADDEEGSGSGDVDGKGGDSADGSSPGEENEQGSPTAANGQANGSTSNGPTTRIRLANRNAVVKEETPARKDKDKGLFDLKVESDDEATDPPPADTDLLLQIEDKEKLNVVIKAFAPDLLRMRIAPPTPSSSNDGQAGLGISVTTTNGLPRRTAGAERRAARTDTLDDLLIMPDLSLKKLRSHFLQLQAPLTTSEALRVHLSGSHVAPSRDSAEAQRARLKTISTCLALVDEIARRYRYRRSGKMPPKKSGGDGPEREYALQMRLPVGDYFTNAVKLSDKEAQSLDTGHAHLVNVATSRPRVSTRVPTLGERLFGEVSSSRRRAGVIVPPQPMQEKRYCDEDYAKPVTHLYYGPWASFAPTYDSFEGQLSCKASNALYRAKRDARSVLEAWAKNDEEAERAKLEEALDDIDDDEIDPDAILKGFDELPAAGLSLKRDNTSVDGILHYNAKLLQRLHEMQDARWRRLIAMETKADEAGEDAELDEPSAAEHAIAHQLMDSLTSLLASRPQHEGQSIVPTAMRLHAASTSAAVDPALLDGRADAGLWGSLQDDVAAGPMASQRGMPMPPRRPAIICDNETLKMTGEAEERAAEYLKEMHAPPKPQPPQGDGGPRHRQQSGRPSSVAPGPPHGHAGQRPTPPGPSVPPGQPGRTGPPPQGRAPNQGHSVLQGRPQPPSFGHGRPTPHQHPVGSQTPFARPSHPSLGVGAPARS